MVVSCGLGHISSPRRQAEVKVITGVLEEVKILSFIE